MVARCGGGVTSSSTARSGCCCSTPGTPTARPSVRPRSGPPPSNTRDCCASSTPPRTTDGSSSSPAGWPAHRSASGWPSRPSSADEARFVVASVAEALAAAAAEGVHHLVLDPRDVLLTDHGVVVVGIGVRAALEGVPADDDAEQVDAWRIGALLYAALTAKWPGYPCAGLPGAPVVGGRVARPRQVRAGVPSDLDEVAWRSLHPDVPDPLDSPAAIAAALHEPWRRQSRPPPSREPMSGTVWRWLGLLLVLALFSVGAVLIAWQFWQNSERPDEPAEPRHQSPSGRRRHDLHGRHRRRAVRCRSGSATAFDPAGDGTENDADTRWRSTVTWPPSGPPSPTPAGTWAASSRASVLSSSLGKEQSVSGVELRLVGRGSDLQVWAARPTTDPKGPPPARPTPPTPSPGTASWPSVRGASDLVSLRFSPAVTTDRVLIWFTALPAVRGRIPRRCRRGVGPLLIRRHLRHGSYASSAAGEYASPVTVEDLRPGRRAAGGARRRRPHGVHDPGPSAP